MENDWEEEYMASPLEVHDCQLISDKSCLKSGCLREIDQVYQSGVKSQHLKKLYLESWRTPRGVLFL